MFIRLWGEFSMTGPAVQVGITVRSCCLLGNIFSATNCLPGNFPTHHAPSVNDCELWIVYGMWSVQPRSSISADAVYNRLQIAVENVARPDNAHEVRRHALHAWEAMSAAIANANRWSFLKDTDDVQGTRKPVAETVLQQGV